MPDYTCPYFTLTSDQLAKYRTAFPRVNLVAELINIEDWCRRNPARVKGMKNWTQFFTNCFKRVRKPVNPYQKHNADFRKQMDHGEPVATQAEIEAIFKPLAEKMSINNLLKE